MMLEHEVRAVAPAKGRLGMSRVTVDTESCIGSGQCALMAPKVFLQSDDGMGEVIPGMEDGADDPLVWEAASACPVQAILIDED